MIDASKLTGDGVAIIHYLFHLSGLRSIPWRRQSVAQTSQRGSSGVQPARPLLNPLVNTQTCTSSF